MYLIVSTNEDVPVDVVMSTTTERDERKTNVTWTLLIRMTNAEKMEETQIPNKTSKVI